MNKRVVVITGATGSLGGLTAREFARQNASLALLSNNQEKLDALTGDLNLPSERILSLSVDLLDGPATLSAAEVVLKKFGRVDTLIHLVGGWTGGKTVLVSPHEDFTFMLNQHLWTTLHLSKAFLLALAESGRGRFIAVSSPLAENPTAGMSAYAVGKSAQETLLRTIACEHAESGLTANVIQVKAIDVKGSGKGTPPEEIFAAISYLCSAEAGKLNGRQLKLY